MKPQPKPASEGLQDCLWISQDDIVPANIDILKKLLKAQSSHVKYWILLAFSYRCFGELELFEHLLKDAEGRMDVGTPVSDSVEDYHGAIYSALALHNFAQAELFVHHEKRHVRHLDLANHYVSRRGNSKHYTWDISMGQYHMSNFLNHRHYEECIKAKECFHRAMRMRPQSVVSVIYYANILVLETRYQLASIYYMRALLHCYHIEMLLKIRDAFSQSPTDEMKCKLYQLQVHVRYVKALILFSLACCKFYDFDIESALTLVKSSLDTNRTPMALRLKAVIASTRILGTVSKSELGASVSVSSSPREAVASLVSGWNDAVCEAHVLDPSNGIGQLHLCEFLFHHGLVDECERRLNEIKRHLMPPALHAELAYQLGRCSHAKGEMNKALNHYSNALSVRSDFLPARMQLIKASIGSCNLAVAREHCDFLMKHNHRNVELLRLFGLAYLASALETLDSCRTQLLRGVSVLDDLDIMCTLSNVQHDVGRLVDERLFKCMGVLEDALCIDPHDQLSQEYLIYCLELLVSRGRENLTSRLRDAYVNYNKSGVVKRCVEFRNNDAILALRCREWDEGVNKLSLLWDEISASCDVPANIKLSVQFNLAVAHEDAGNTSKAHRMYSSLTYEYPRYIPAWLRKSHLAFRRGDLESGQRYLEQLKGQCRRSIDAWVYKGYQFFVRCKFDECIDELRKMFRAIPNASFDAYANTLFACALIRRSNRGVFAPLPKEVLHYARAGLRRHSICNFYAANCVAVYLAHEGQLKSAYESFGILLENSGNSSQMKFIAHWNMGLICGATALSNEHRVERGNYDRMRASKAQQHFHTALCNGKLSCVAHLGYARFLYDCQRFEDCVQYLEKCRRLFPNDRKFLYNLVVAVDAMLCRHMRNSEMLASATEVSKMLIDATFVKNATAHLIAIHSDYPKMSLTHLQQIHARMVEKLIPHMIGTIPQLEAAAAAKQHIKGKHLELQMSIQQAHEARRLEMELERQRAAEAERLLSEQLLKEASEIASELVYSRPPGPGSTVGGR